MPPSFSFPYQPPFAVSDSNYLAEVEMAESNLSLVARDVSDGSSSSDAFTSPVAQSGVLETGILDPDVESLIERIQNLKIV